MAGFGAGAVDLGVGYVSIIPETKNIGPGINKALSGASVGADKAGEGIGSRMASGLGKTLKVGAVAAAGVAAVGIGTALAKGFERATAIEDAQAKLRGLGNSAQDVGVIMDNALASVKGTAFGLDEAATTAAGAIAAGIKPGKQLEGTLKSVANSAAAAGIGMDEMGGIYNKVASVGKAQNDVLRQVAERGIPIYEALAQQLGVTTEEVFNMASAGEIGFTEFEQAMTAASGTVADELGGTTTGAIKNFGAALGRLGESVISAGLPHFRDGVKLATEWVDSLTNKVGPLADAVGQKLGSALEVVVKWLSGLDFSSWSAFTDSLGGSGDAFASIGDSIRRLGPAFAEFGQALPAIGSAALTLAGAGLTVLTSTLKFLADNVDTIIAFMPAIIAGFAAWKLTSTALAASQTRLMLAQTMMAPVFLTSNLLRWQAVRAEAALATATATSTTATAANTTAQNAGMLTRARATAAMVGQRIAMVATTAATWAATAATTALGVAMKIAMGPIGLIIAGIAAVVAGLVWFFTQTETGKQVWEGFVNVLQGVWQWIQSTFAPVWEWLSGLVSGAWESIKNTIGGIVDLVAGVGRVIADIWNNGGDGAGGDLLTKLLGEGWSNIITGAIGKIKEVWDALSAGFGWAADKISSAWGGIKNVLGGVAGWVKDAFSGIFDLFVKGDFTSSLASAFGIEEDSPIVVGILKLRDIIGGAFGTIGDVVSTVFSTIGSIIGGAWTNVIQPVLEGFANIIGSVASTVGPIILDVLVFAFRTLGNVIWFAWESIIKPAFDAFQFALKILAAVFGTIILGSILVAWNLLSATISALWNGVIKPVWDGFVAVVTWLWTNVLSPFFAWIGQAFMTVATFLWNLWTTYIKVIWDTFAAVVSWLWNSVLMPVFGFISTAFTTMATFLWNVWVTVIKVVWDAFAAAVQWIWNVIIMPIFNLIKLAFQAVGTVFQFVWNSIIKPAWDALGAGISWVWNTVVNPVWNAMKAGLSALGTFFQMVWNNIIKPAWDALGTGISWVVDNVVRPAFERIKSALDSVKNFFSTVVDGIRTIWDQLKGHVARPINFVIETVWNNGLVRAWNKIGEFLPGLPAASTLAPIAFARGGNVPLMPGSKKGKDSVNAMLMPGEHVLTVADVKAMGGQQNVYAFRQALHGDTNLQKFGGESLLPGFKDGGEVSGGVRLAPTPGEGGMKAIAILAKRLIHKIWPEITTIGGYRPYDAYPEHPSGRALDVMVPNLDLGDQVNGWTHANNEVLPFIHTIWKQRWRPAGNPEGSGMEDRGSPTQNHMDHVHTWYQDVPANPNVVPEGLVGYDGLSDADRIEILKEKVKEILDKIMDPIKDGMSAILGDPPPEWLGLPHPLLDMSKDTAVDEAFGFIEKLGEKLKEAYDLAKDVVKFIGSKVFGLADGGAITKDMGLFRDEGGMIPTGQSIVRNETGKPEAVLNWRQIDRIRDILASLKNIEEFQKLAEVVGGMVQSGVYDPRAAQFGITGEDDELVKALWFSRDEWFKSAVELDKIMRGAAEKAATGYRDEALDFFGFKDIFDTATEIQDAFTPKDNAVASETGVAVSTDPGLTPTGTGVSAGQELVYGDPNVRIGQVEMDSTVKMPSFDSADNGFPGSGPVKDQVKEAFAPRGWDKGPMWDAADWIIGKESSWDPMARNPSSGAFGLFQFLGATKQTYLPDENPNPKIQGTAGARYISDRYGDPLKAKAFWERNGWYDKGGWLMPGLTLTNNETGKPEAVLNPSQWAKITRQTDLVADMAEGNSGGPLVVIENLHATSEDEAMRAAMREARRANRSNALAGGWV